LTNTVDIVRRIRDRSGVPPTRGPADDRLLAAVDGFVGRFDYWYIRVVREAVGKYRSLIIARINPFIRGVELEGLTPVEAAGKLVDDYISRNFVTAGGWALEEMAVSVNPEFQKSPARGIDVQRRDPTTGEYHLYVLKSGLVTRNSDIVNALKRNAREAQKLLRQSGNTRQVHLNYAIAAGRTKTTFEDGVNRPSSPAFWAEVLDLPEEEATPLALATAAEAGRLVKRNVSEHVDALKLLVREYIAVPDDDTRVDWPFINQRNMQPQATWKAEDKARNTRALEALRKSGYGAATIATAEATADDQETAEQVVETEYPENSDAS
jgi:hypothetical protein